MTNAFDRVTFRGHLMDRKTQAFLEAMEAELGYELTVLQGCYNPGGVAASGGTHDGGGVVDLAPADHERKVKVARALGAFAWFRPELWIDGKRVWGDHVHLGIRNHGRLAAAARAQQADYDATPARNGLASHAPDPTWHPRPAVTFTYPKPKPATTRVITANVPIRKLTADEMAAALDAVLKHRPTYVGLQEWGEDRLLKLAALRGYGYARADGGPPILFQLNRTGLLRVRARRLAHAEFVGHLIGRKDRLPRSVATEAVFEDDVLGEVAHLNAHLTAEVQSAGGYREDAAHLLRVLRHKRERQRLRRRVRHHKRAGRRVFVTVDGNFDGLELRPLTSCWSGREGHTLGSRAVDVIFAEKAARKVRTVTTGSDHRAVVVDY